MKKGKNLRDYLEAYYKIQTDILLCYRPTSTSWWNDRTLYLSDTYQPRKPYNHRMLLNNEVCIEFDEDNKEVNRIHTDTVINKLTKFNIPYSAWWSGNKSYHLHFFIYSGEAKRIESLKLAAMKFFTNEVSVKFDSQLAHPHLIRAEFGVNEKNIPNKESIMDSHLFSKKLYKESSGYPRLAHLPKEVWDEYNNLFGSYLKGKMTSTIKDAPNNKYVKFLVDTSNFDKIRDGRERIIFTLANVLSDFMEKKELIELLQNWYKYTSGDKLTPGQIAYKVYKAYANPYVITEFYLKTLLADLGVDVEKVV